MIDLCTTYPYGLTVHISARTPARQHVGERDLGQHEAGSPAAEHFMHHGALHVFVRRREYYHG